MNRMNSTRFLEVEEFRTQLVRLDLSGDRYPVGGVPLSAEGNSLWVDASDSHTIVFGATGSKKTRMLVMPTVEILSRAGEPFVVTDPKGEVYERTSGGLEARGYQVFALNLRDYEAGDAWNPLLLPYQYYKAGDKPKAIELVSSIAGMLVQQDTEDAFWSNTARDVAIGLILLLFEEVSEEEECSIRNLFSLWQRYLSDRKGFCKMLRQEYADSIVLEKMQSLNNASDKTVGSVEAVFGTGLNRLATNEKLIDFLSQPGMHFEAMTKERTAVYLIVPDENKFYHFVVSLFLEQLYEVLIKKAQMSEGAKLSERMNFLVDEFANLPAIENFDSMITASRSRNIRFLLIVQSMNQLKEKYDKTAEVICSNCNNWIYLYSKEYDLLTQISKLCGEVIYDNNMRMPLISEFDLQHLSKEKGEALVLCGRNCPCLVNLPDIDEYPFERKECLRKRTVMQEVKRLRKRQESSRGSCELFDDLLRERCFQPVPHIVGGNSGTVDDLFSTTWLVATFRDMVVKSYLVDGLRIRDKTAIMGYSLRDFSPEEAAQIEWYIGSNRLRNLYQQSLTRHPELVFHTVEELNCLGKKDGERLYPEENCFLVWKSDLEKWKPDNELAWSVSLKYEVDGEKTEKDLGMQELWGYNLGVVYTHNLIFRIANEELKGSAFENACWQREGLRNMGRRGMTITYVKTTENGDRVTLMIKSVVS